MMLKTKDGLGEIPKGKGRGSNLKIWSSVMYHKDDNNIEDISANQENDLSTKRPRAERNYFRNSEVRIYSHFAISEIISFGSRSASSGSLDASVILNDFIRKFISLGIREFSLCNRPCFKGRSNIRHVPSIRNWIFIVIKTSIQNIFTSHYVFRFHRLNDFVYDDCIDDTHVENF